MEDDRIYVRQFRHFRERTNVLEDCDEAKIQVNGAGTFSTDLVKGFLETVRNHAITPDRYDRCTRNPGIENTFVWGILKANSK